MEKKRDIKVFIEQLTKPRVEALFSELFDEYANKGIDKKQFAVKLLTGELEGIMDDYVDAFMGKTALTITDMDTNQLNSKVISKVKLTYFSVEDLSYFISDIVEAMESVSEEYSKLFAVLTAIGYNYQNKGFILPNLLYVDDITLYPYRLSAFSRCACAERSCGGRRGNYPGTDTGVFTQGSESHNGYYRTGAGNDKSESETARNIANNGG